MFVDVALTGSEVDYVDMSTFGAVAVIDVLRATTTILTALENGARGVVPVATPDEAYAWRDKRTDVVLGGERAAVRIAGFDLGNSPLEYTPGAVGDKLVVLTTTNGTQAFAKVQRAGVAKVGGGSGVAPAQGPDDEADCGSPAVYAVCLRNAAAAARALVDAATRRGCGALIVCSGTDGRFSREDAYCAAVLLAHMEQLTDIVRGDGADIVARSWPGGRADEAWSELSGSFHGRRLLKLGLSDDVRYCAQVNVSEIVPWLLGGTLVLAGTGGKNGE